MYSPGVLPRAIKLKYLKKRRLGLSQANWSTRAALLIARAIKLMNDRLPFDYVIIGAGAAGCVLAEALSQDANNRVCILEAGGADWSPILQIPAGKVYALGNPKFDWRYQTEPDPTRHDRVDVWPRGKVVGGSTSINGLFYVRGNPTDFDDWAALGNDGWAYDDVLPYFKQIESYSGGDDNFRGRSGRLRISDVPSPHKLSSLFVDAACEAGIPRAADYNGYDQEGAALAQTTIHAGIRQSASRAFLREALRRPNLTLITNAHAETVVVDSGLATGVTYSKRGKTKRVIAKREVLLCAGAVATPKLLMLSGIGPRDHLEEMGIETRANLPGVGENLQEHCGIWIMQGVRKGIRTANMDYNLFGILKHGLRYLFSREGQAATPTSQALAFIKTSLSEPEPDAQIHFMPMGYSIGDSAINVLPTPAMMAVPNVSRPTSRGSLQLASSDPRAPPRIYPRFFDNRDDMQRLIAACRIVRKIFSTGVFSGVAEGEIFPGPDVVTDRDWENVLRKHAGPVFHIAGTCKMGQDDMSVVGSDLCVHGVQKLRIVDASIMPTITSGNTNAPTMMIAAKAADMITAKIN